MQFEQKLDVQGWQDALAEHDNATLTSYPALDHHLVAGEGPFSPDDYAESGNVDEAVIIDIADWVLTLDWALIDAVARHRPCSHRTS